MTSADIPLQGGGAAAVEHEHADELVHKALVKLQN